MDEEEPVDGIMDELTRKLMDETVDMTFTVGEWAYITAILTHYSQHMTDVQPMLIISAINQNVADAAKRGDIGKFLR
ncbi:hypothetical protein QEH42_gp074 [Microbacterium phage Pumpernickel]|uniref:Uncharacterized protein n=1 Tax=Microbacterium phage Pumpernickel TaxID=2885983 RepID=A0AAE8Y7D6_9CAUD|nr:hypothetical protein QEH42_gp074 [Microbacterium phage Pumpernickel]UDL15865.1 hypothetical protein SEA_PUMPERNICKEL_74 [Microbacterium phage Pumpernickel]